MMRVPGILAAAFAAGVACGPGPAAALDQGETSRPALRAVEKRAFVLEEGQTRIEIGRSFIVPESDSVLIDGAPLRRGGDYRINTLRGSIVLVKPASGGERLIVRFSRYPLPFGPVFASRVAEGAPPLPLEPLVSPAPGREERRAAEPYQLRLSGSKTVGVNMGSNKDLGLDQSLRVTMVGKVAKDLEVNAFLTDDNLPVQPEGNTEELKYLDKVSVEVKAKHSAVQLGDFTSALSSSQFSSFRRELRGVAASVNVKGQSFNAGGGVAKGRFKTVSFVGKEGIQGPYELLPARRFNAVIILAGTERIYFNGRVLKRGSENDYTIDYTRGTVTFMERVVVTNDSEIVIDYEMSEDNYERTTVTAGWLLSRPGGSLNLRAFFFQESDDTGKPAFGSIGAADEAVLEAAGDDPSKATTSGIERVEPGKGDYILVPADSLPAHFKFAASGGDYRLDFFEVGSGKGDYLVDSFSAGGIVTYRYAGEGRGDFLIGRFLPLPERTRVFTFGASAAKDALFFETEGDVSVHDKNLFSTIDDGDNTGRAMKLSGGLKNLDISVARLSLAGEYSTLDDRFASPDKRRESYFYREWGLEGVPFSGSEDIGGGRISLSGARSWNVVGSYLSLSRGAELSARKADVAGGIGDMERRGISLRAFASKVGSERERRFAQGSGVLSIGHLAPRLVIEGERYVALQATAPDTGRYYRQGVFSVAGRDIGAYRANLSLTRRLTDELDSLRAGWIRARDNAEISFDGGFSKGGRILELLATHRRMREARFGDISWYNLARLRARDSWEKAALAADLSYRMSAGEERTRQRAVVFVGESQGDYDKEGREVGQKRGDYMVLYLPGGDMEPVRTVELAIQVSAGAGVRGLSGEAGDGSLFGRIMREVSLDHSFTVVENSRTGDLAGLYLLNPSLLQRNDVTVYGVNKLREEITLFNSSRIFKLHISYSREDEEDNRLEGSFSESFSRDARVRVESAPWDALAFTWEAGSTLREREATGFSGLNYRVGTNSLAQILTYRFTPSTRLSFELGAEDRADEVSEAKQISYVATPSLSSSIGERLNLASSFKLTYTDAKSETGKPLFFLEEGIREDWSLMGQYRVSRNISFGLNYNGRREKDYAGEVKTVHDLKFESRAYF
jgi:hypothetical protein